MSTLVKTGKMSNKSLATRYIAYPLETLAALLFLGFFKALPVRIASNAGSFIARKIGPFFSVQKIARNNLERAFPDKSEREIEKIINDMWDNLGRNLGELVHLADIYKNHENYVSLKGMEHIEDAVKTGKPIIFVTAHTGNWEVATLPHYVADVAINIVYRAANNPWVEKLVYQKLRDLKPGEMIPKGAPGAKRIIQLMNEGKHIGLLSDQKMNDGIAVGFFGRDAMTAPATAQFALRYNSPIVPIRVIRKGAALFDIEIEKPFYVEKTGNRVADIANTMRKINQIYERWITEHPAQWLWVHRRWPKGS